MRIRAKIPLDAYFLGSKAEKLDLVTQFSVNGKTVQVAFEGPPPEYHEQLPEDCRHFRLVQHLVLTIIEGPKDDGSSTLQALIEAENRSQLVAFLVPIINRVLLALRNFGRVPKINQIHFEPEEALRLLREWNVEISDNSQDWRGHLARLEGIVRGLFGPIRATGITEFRTIFWPDVEEAIQDSIPPGPEQEFITNSLEYLWNRNYRLALLEAIVSLEIILSQFLQFYLQNTLSFSKTKMEKVLPISLSLVSRVGLLLELILTPGERKSVQIQEVLTAINWRNSVVHKTGHLPPGLLDEHIDRHIRSVLSLALLLAGKRDQAAAKPELREFSKEISERWALPPPTITRLARHKWVVEFNLLLDREFPPPEKLREVAETISQGIQTRDHRFDPAEHLFVRFAQFQTTIAVWSAGEIRQIEKPLPLLRPGATLSLKKT